MNKLTQPAFVWADFITQLKNKIEQPSIESWLIPLTFKNVDFNILSLEAPSNFVKQWVLENYKQIMLQELRLYGIEEVEIVICNSISNTKQLSNVTTPKYKEEFDSIHYLPTSMIYAALPIQDCKKNSWIINNEKSNISTEYSSMGVSGQDPAGIPFGKYGRLLLDYIVSKVKKEHATIINLGDTYKDVCNTLNIPKGSTSSKKLLDEQWRRVLGCAVIATKEYYIYPNASNRNVKRKLKELTTQMLIVSAHLKESEQGHYTIKISDDFKSFVLGTIQVPFSQEIVLKLFKSPLAMDLYKHLNYRVYYANKYRRNEKVSFKELHQAFGQQGGYKQFISSMRSAIALILEVVPSFHISTVERRNDFHFLIDQSSVSTVNLEKLGN